MNKKLLTASRLIFGLGFLVFGLNGFINFMPTPPVSPEAGAMLGALAKTGYFFPMIKVLEILIGILILTGFFVPLAITAAFPILIGITTIHIFLNPTGLPMMILLHVLHGILVKGYWKNLAPVLEMKG